MQLLYDDDPIKVGFQAFVRGTKKTIRGGKKAAGFVKRQADKASDLHQERKAFKERYEQARSGLQ